MLTPFIGFELATSNITVPESYYNEKRRRSKHIFFLFSEKTITFFFWLLWIFVVVLRHVGS